MSQPRFCSPSPLPRTFALRATLLLALFAGCTNSDKSANPTPDKPNVATTEAKPEAKSSEAKPAADKPAEEKPAADKPAEAAAAAEKAEPAKEAIADGAPKADAAKPEQDKAKVAGDAPKQAAEAPKSAAKEAASQPATAPKAGAAKPTKIDSKTGILTKGAADKYVKVGSRPVIRLLEAGAEPRATASFELVKGAAKPLQMGMDLEMSMEAGGLKMPPTTLPRMNLTFDFSTADKADSDWPIDGKLRKVTVEPKGATQEQIAAALRPQLGSLEGIGMNYFVDAKGRIRDVKVTLPPTIPPAAGQMMSGMTQSIESMTSPLPDEAVGIGAKWEVLSRIAANGADLLQIATFTLEKREGEILSLDVVVKQFAAKDAVTPPGMPPGAKARLLSYKSQGGGKTVVDVKDIAPKSGTMTVNSAMDIELTVTEAGTTEKQNTTVDTKLTASYSRP